MQSKVSLIRFKYFIFLSQFGALIQLSTSYIGAQILVLPFVYQNKKVLKNYLKILPILIFSYIIGVFSYGEFRFLEIMQRLISFAIIVYVLTFFKEFIRFSNIDIRLKFIKSILVLSIPSLLLNYMEIFYLFFNGFKDILIVIKKVLIPNRIEYTLGTIAGIFPEHGLFPPYLFMIVGISLTYLLYTYKSNFNFLKLIAFSWILFGVIHLSGLYYFSIGITLLIYSLLLIINLIRKLEVSKIILKTISFTLILMVPFLYVISTINSWFLNRIYQLIINLPSILNLNLANVLDTSFKFKFLAFIAAKFMNLRELFFGTGLSSYTDFVIKVTDKLPFEITNISYFIQNFESERFALNSYLLCLFIELGGIFFILLLILLPKPSKITIKEILPIPGYVFIKKNKSGFEKLIFLFMIFSFSASFFSIFGAVPLLYPYPWISFCFIFLVIENEKLRSLS